MISENPKALDAVLEIRNRSKKGMLTQIEDLCASHEMEREEADSILRELGEENHMIELESVVDRNGNAWYYSRTEMIPSYALTLLRIQDEDIVALVADTVRNESRIYPRATQLSVFRGAPYRLTDEQLQVVLEQLKENPETQDIQMTESSNGVQFLFSTEHLTPFYAQRLAEWEEVGSKENP